MPGTPFLWTITAPANGAKSVYTGIELTWQHLLDNGFGTHMQYTHTWQQGLRSDRATPTGAVNAAPPTTVSISLIYDKGPLNADVTWDYTSQLHLLSARSAPKCPAGRPSPIPSRG